ncbi:hypothetical protein CMI37_39315 [Candidatus Pacearchaeota archaeon]|nr:hypothetical protein [Candidatus Pacearchaeota archaeon]|tara:strand:+ start:7233 stop:7442 length:210 start_codon:yes stop_codon:yes gene_type:complete
MIDSLKEKDRIQKMIEKSKTYKEILKHRRKCKKWNKGFCLDCFGGGVNRLVMKLYFKDKLRMRWLKFVE